MRLSVVFCKNICTEVIHRVTPHGVNVVALSSGVVVLGK
jgi:hypothetical protein